MTPDDKACFTGLLFAIPFVFAFLALCVGVGVLIEELVP